MQSLWDSDVILALIVTAFALFAPYLKTIGLGLLHFGLLSPKTNPFLSWLGKLAMADIFLINDLCGFLCTLLSWSSLLD